jgi:predicted GIY-YIG superfamily endonuclease
MGRGQYSKMVRKSNRMIERGTKLGGTQHTNARGKKWTRKDVLEVRKKAQRENSVDSALIIENTLKSRNKGNSQSLVQKMEAFRGNTE